MKKFILGCTLFLWGVRLFEKEAKWLCSNFLWLGLLFISPQVVFGQLQNSALPAPEAAALIRNINVPVDYYTGVANIQIPLYGVQSTFLTFPITLQYQASGIKVEDIATWVGLGWRLTAGGRITRVVRKEPDENGFCKGSGVDSDGYKSLDIDTWKKDGKFDDRLNGTFDSEPDIFYFEIPGKQGMFVFDYSGNPYTIPYQNIDIQWVNKQYFVITDENGTQYTFGVNTKESTRVSQSGNSGKAVGPYTSTWFLEQIMSVSGDVINFSYEAGSSYGYTSYNSYTTFTFSIDKMNGDFYNENGYIRNEQVHEMDTYISIDSPQYLKTISWRSGKLEFISSGGRKDIPAMRKLDEIKVYTQTGEYLKSIKFTYSNRNNRLWLEQVREQANGLYLPICQLVYNYELPARNSNAFDFWGYYNGTSSESKIPSGNYWGAIIDGVSREPSLQYTLEGILTKIRYSTGGITEFEYELNEGCKKNDPQKYKCGGLRIKAIKRISTDTLVTRYHYSSDIFSKIWSSGEIFSGFNFNIRYKDINSTDDNNGNRRNYEASCFTKTGFDLFDVNGAPVLYNSVIVEEPTGLCMQYKYTSLHDSLTADVPSTLHMINGFFSRTVENNGLFFKNSSRFWKRGLLKECRVFPKNGGVSKITAYEYVLDQNVKKVVKGFEQRTMNAMQNNPERTLCVYEWVSQPVYLKRVVENGSPANVGSETEMTYDTTTLLPQIIKVKNMATGTVYKTKTKYPQDFGREINNVVEGDTVAYALKGLDSHHVLMCPIEKVYYRDNVIVGAEIYEYRWHTFANRTEGPVLYRTKSLPLKSPVEFYSSYCYNSLTKKMVCDARLEIVDSFEDYDVYGNVMMKKENFGNNISIIYGYNYSLPVAVVENANARKEVYYTSFEFENSGTILSDKAKSGRKVCNSMLSIPLDNKKTGEYLVTYWESTNGGNTWKKYSEVFNLSGCTTVYTVRGSASRYIDELRILPRDARISTMAYIPGVGIVSETDHNGNTVYYEYDAFGRLIRVLDNDRKIVKQYEYKMN